MSFSASEVADRVEIQAVLAAYSAAVDSHDWALLDDVFVADCQCDFTDVADFSGDRESLKRWLAAGMPQGRQYYHLLGVSHIVLEGDGAEAVTPCINPMPFGDGGLGCFGHWYRDSLVRTERGWRIKRRYLEFSWFKQLAVADEHPFRSPWG